MKQRWLILLAILLLALVGCSDDNDGDHHFSGPIVPIDSGWQWIYEIGTDGDCDTLSYPLLPDYEYQGHSDWHSVCWNGNEGDNSAIARLDSVGLFYAWPGWRGEGTFDRMGRKISDEASIAPPRTLEYYLAKYPIVVGDSWDVLGDGRTIAVCVTLDDLIESTYLSTKAVHYDFTYDSDTPQPGHEHYYYKPGIGWLYWEDESSGWNYDLVDIVMPESTGRNPLAP